MKKLVGVLLVLVCAVRVFGQDALPQKVSFDFDGDKKADVFQIKSGHLSYTLSSQKGKETQSQGVSYSDRTWLELSKNVVVYQCAFNRGQNTFKFRYDPKLKQFKLIGYDNEQFGNAANDGSGRSSYNLLTGDYVANWNYFDNEKEVLVARPEVRKKLPLKTYLLKDFGEAMIDQLYEIDMENEK